MVFSTRKTLHTGIMKIFLQKTPLALGIDKYERLELKPSAQQKTDQSKTGQSTEWGKSLLTIYV